MKRTFSTLTLGAIMLGVMVAILPMVSDAATKTASTTAAASPAKLQATQKKADTAIAQRVTDLNKAIARADQMTRLSDSDKATIQTALQTIVTNISALGTKIDADTDADTLKTDVKSITDTFRIYALVIPRTHIIAAADRAVTIAGTLNLVGQKLTSRVSAATGSSAASLQKTLKDMSDKVVDAQAQAQSATQMVAALQPDNGDAATLKSNTQTLKDAQAKIKTAQSDLTTAQKDARTIQKGLKALPKTASTTPTVTQ